jgi:hypothetical protein
VSAWISGSSTLPTSTLSTNASVPLSDAAARYAPWVNAVTTITFVSGEASLMRFVVRGRPSAAS